MTNDPQAAAARRMLLSAVHEAQREAGAAQTHLHEATARFTAVSEQVILVVGGSAQQVDQQMIQSLQDAVRHTRSALAALNMVQSAMRTAR